MCAMFRIRRGVTGWGGHARYGGMVQYFFGDDSTGLGYFLVDAR